MIVPLQVGLYIGHGGWTWRLDMVAGWNARISMVS